MYINFNTLYESRLNGEDLLNLIAIKQLHTERVEELTLAEYSRLQELSLVKHIKAKNKKEHPYTSLRLSQKGVKFLEELETADVEEEDERVFKFLKDNYLAMNKTVGNGARALRHIRDFRVKSGIQKNNLVKLCLAFIRDEDNMQYNNVLEYSFYKPLTVYQTKFNLEDSRLYKYYLKREDYFKSIFEEY